MPNHNDNRLAIRGVPNDVMALVESVAGDTPLDFNRVIPMPEAIRSGGDYQASGVPGSFPGWYQWSCENWGVKWNAYWVTRRGYGRTGRVRYRFATAYGPPNALLDEIARQFPRVEMDLTYDVELLGSGFARWSAGSRVEDFEILV